ncbi:MAG: dicarboxylate/amino acid:cation symporter [Holosporales bacterium]|nr:dicarboxylate/amino acid:cation symporter [Holosporales bacterium]
MSVGVKSFLYSISLSIKECLIFSLPIIIFSLVFCSTIRLGVNTVKYILIIVPLVCCSNFLNTILSYLVSLMVIDTGQDIQLVRNTIGDSQLSSTFEITLKNFISNDLALLFGVILGPVTCFLNKKAVSQIVKILEAGTKCYFKVLIPIMPFFIIGASLKLQHDGVLSQMFERYSPILLMFVASAYCFILLQYFALAGFSLEKVVTYLKNIFPAMVTAFGSMSSASALPLSIRAAEKNLMQRDNASVIVTSTVNIHLVGDCFFIPMVAMAVMASFGVQIPYVSNYVIFAIHFVLAKFAVAAVPGGGILVMLPILQQCLDFSPEMLAFVTALYILFDPVITVCNVGGNGALAILFDKITRFKFKR